MSKAFRRTPSERSYLARLGTDVRAEARDFWVDHADGDDRWLIDADGVFAGEPHAGVSRKSVWNYLTNLRVYEKVATGIELAAEIVRGAVDRVADAGMAKARELTAKLRAGAVSLAAWQTSMESLVRTVHAATGLVGGGGNHVATPPEVAAVERRIESQFGWLESFAVEIESGLPLTPDLDSRAAMYAEAAIGTYERSRRVGDVTEGGPEMEERRRLHARESCKDCKRYAALGWQPSLTLPDIGEECQCKSRCRCTFERRRQEQAPKKGKAMSASVALEYLLSQPLLCTDEMADLAARIANREADPKSVATRKGEPDKNSRGGMEYRAGVAIVPICGPISRYAMMLGDLDCGGCSVEQLARDLQSAADNPAVRSILLNVDSPGGEASGIGELAGLIKRIDTDAKPVYAYVGNQGCSAAYWLPSAARQIVCAESATLGSIGVVMGMKKAAPKAGEKEWEFVSTVSPNKRPDPGTDDGRAEIMKWIDGLASVFIENVAKNRGVTTQAVVNDFGKGGVMIARDAVAAGMADGVGDFETCLGRIAKGMTACDPVARKSSRRPVPSTPSTTAAAGSKPKGMPMSFDLLSLIGWAKKNPEVAALLSDAENDAAQDVTAAVASLAAGKGVKATVAATEAEIRAQIRAEFESANLQALESSFKAQAEALFDGLVAAGKAIPFAKALTVAHYVEAAILDATKGPVTATDAAGATVTSTRVSQVLAAVKAPAVDKTGTAVADTQSAAAKLKGLTALPADDATEAADAEKAAIKAEAMKGFGK